VPSFLSGRAEFLGSPLRVAPVKKRKLTPVGGVFPVGKNIQPDFFLQTSFQMMNHGQGNTYISYFFSLATIGLMNEHL